MHRRTVLTGGGLLFAGGVAGCLDRVPGMGLDTEFEETEPELAADEPPDVTVDDGTVTARGTITYGSSQCGTAELAHAEYEGSQSRLDLLVVAADDSTLFGGCTDDLVSGGYRVRATVDDSLRRVSVTEHHVFGEAYSTTVDANGP